MEDDQQFCLRWNNHQSTLISVFDTLLENETLVDCTIAAEGRFLKAHKVVLSACSPYFATLLQEQYDKHPIFILKDVKFQELRAMMDYMYRGEVNISQDQLAALLKAAESLQIKGLSDNRGTAPRPEQPPRANVPIGKGGYTLESKRPRIGPGPLDPQDVSGSREGSSSPSRRRRKVRRRSIENDVHDNSNSSATPQSQQSNANLAGVSAITAAALASQMAAGASVVSPAAIAVVAGQQAGTTALTTNVPKKTETNKGTSDAINAETLQQTTGTLTGTAIAPATTMDEQDTEHIAANSAIKEQKANHKQQKAKDNAASTISPGDMNIEPKSEYDEEANEESVEDLTLDDEMGMEDLDHNAGTSQGGEGSSQDYAWPHDRSQDGLLLTTQDAQQRDPQDKLDKSEQTDSAQEDFELDDCILESNDIVITQNKDGFVLHVKKYGNVTASKIDGLEEEDQHQPQDTSDTMSPTEHDHHDIQVHEQETITIVPATCQTIATTGAQISEIQHVADVKQQITQLATVPHTTTIKLPSTECELIDLKKMIPATTTITTTQHPHIATIIQPHHQHIQHHQVHHQVHHEPPQQTAQQHHTITIHPHPHVHAHSHTHTQHTTQSTTAVTHQHQEIETVQTAVETHETQSGQQQHIHIHHHQQQQQHQVITQQAQVQSFVTTTRTGQPQTINVMGLRNIQITEQKPLISRIKYSTSKIIATPTTADVQIVEAHEDIDPATAVATASAAHHGQDMTEVTKYEISEIDLNNPNASAAMISDFVKYAEIDDIELPDGTKIGIGFAPDMAEHMQANSAQPELQAIEQDALEDHHQQHEQQQQQLQLQHHQLQPQQTTHIQLPAHIQMHHSTALNEHLQTSQDSISDATAVVHQHQHQHQQEQQHHIQQQQEHHHHLQQLQLHDPDDGTASVDESIISDTMAVNDQATITKSYTILRPIKQESGGFSGDTTTYELSISDSSMGGMDDPDSKYICRHCGKKYRWKSTLRRHENVECGGKEPCHPCPHCSYKAKQRGNLGVHVRKHHPDKPQLESKRGRKI